MSYKRAFGEMKNMSARSSLNNELKLLLTISYFCSAPLSFATSVETSRSDNVQHGLYEIQLEAKKFIQLENNKSKPKWNVLEPNPKIWVPRCAAPLKTKWVPKDRGVSSPSVWVICDRSIDKKYPKWDVYVPVMKQR